MIFFKNIFKKEKKRPQIKSVLDLQKKDMIKLNDSFSLPKNLRDQTFEVQNINSYNYEGDMDLEWVLKGSDDTLIHLCLDDDDTSCLEFAIKLSRTEIEKLFNIDEFSHIFDSNKPTILKTIGEIDDKSDWTAKIYHQEGSEEEGYYYKKDHRDINADLDRGEAFRLYTLLDSEEDFGLSIEVWNSGETDVYLTIFRPKSDIVDFYPGS
jgi:hypothetical protein